MPSTAAQPDGWCVPAPYGKACAACSRAKCKCFYRPGGTVCERCDRLHRPCQPSASTRKTGSRKTSRLKAQEIIRTAAPAVPPAKTQQQPEKGPAFAVIEEKIDDLMSLLRSQSQTTTTTGGHVGQAAMAHRSRDPSAAAVVGRREASGEPAVHESNLDIIVDKSASVVQFVHPGASPASPPSSPSVIFQDVAAHAVAPEDARHQLAAFRASFLTMFPFVHIPASTTALALQHDKPFLWLVVMCLTARRVQDQFAMEETIWRIIGQRIVVEHGADMDLLHGLVCFSSWSHYFKMDKPFMTTLTQLAVAMALDLDLQLRAPSRKQQKAAGQAAAQPVRTLEERRIFLAVFHLTSATWMAYRKTEPLRWTSYMDECMYALDDAEETPLDALLQSQIRCQIMMNQLASAPSQEDSMSGGVAREMYPSALLATMLRQLGTMRSSKTGNPVLDRTAEFYLLATELTIREASFHQGVGQPQRPPPRRSRHRAGGRDVRTEGRCGAVECFQRVQELEALLACTWRWLDLFFAVPPRDLAGVSVDHFSQLLHCLVVLFRLSTLSSTLSDGLDTIEVDNACHATLSDRTDATSVAAATAATAATEEVPARTTTTSRTGVAETPDTPDMGAVVEDMRRRADVLATLDRITDIIGEIPREVGMVDAEGPRRGIFFKSCLLFGAIRAFMVSAMQPGGARPEADKSSIPPSRLGTLHALETPADVREAWNDEVQESAGPANQQQQQQQQQQQPQPPAPCAVDSSYGVDEPMADAMMGLGGYYLDLSAEPWLSGMFAAQWDLSFEESGLFFQ